MYRRIRRAAAEADRFIAVLQDLSGPKIRIGRVTTPITLEPGGTLAIELGDAVGGPAACRPPSRRCSNPCRRARVYCSTMAGSNSR
jgi:hypothetical protein